VIATCNRDDVPVGDCGVLNRPRHRRSKSRA
jgi:hypothetical protein